MREWVAIYLKGFFMGAADSIPGVSGGTIALITGIYERLIAAIAAIDPRILGQFVKVYDSDVRADLRVQLLEMDVPFLLVLGAGVATAVVSVTRVLYLALTSYPAATYAFFLGLIGASAVVLHRHVSFATRGRIAAAVGGFTAAFLVSGQASGGLSHTLPVVFTVGAIAVTAMILPGISGALFLVLFGQFEFMSGRLKVFVDSLAGLATGGNGVDAVVEPGVAVVTFVSGALVGLLTIAHVVDWALERYRAATLTFLVMLMVGSLRLPFERVLANSNGLTVAGVGLVVLAAGGGAGLVFALDQYTDDLEYEFGEPDGAASERAD